VGEIRDKFIDLAVEDDNSGYGQDMEAKQEKFDRELSKLPFEFDTKFLELPSGTDGNEQHLNMDADNLEQVSTLDETLGKDLDKIYDIMNSKAGLEDVGIIVQHRWTGEMIVQA